MMVQRVMRYALVDLGNQTWDIKEVTADCFGTWGTYLQELEFWWALDPTLVTLTTGILTGTGAPGTGAMTWNYRKGGKVCSVTAEGRLGAYLRCAGVDSLVFLGKSEEPCCVTVDGGELKLTHPKTAYPALLANRKEEDAVLVTVSQSAVVEDKYFTLAGRDVAKQLWSKGVAALSVETTGILPVADPKALIAICTELYQAARRAGTALHSGRKTPARYLSLEHTVDFGAPAAYENPAPDAGDAVYAALGILWSEAFPQRDRRAYTARLITACSGAPCAEEDIDALAEHLAQLQQKKVGEDA